MKGLKKLVLATAVAAAPFAQAELTAMDDSTLEGMTGQAGVSIELSAELTIGSFTYTDTDGYTGTGAPVSGTAAAGDFTMSGIALGGTGATGALDDIKIDIDVDGDQGLIIHLGGTNTLDVLTGGAQAVDFGLSIDNVAVNGATLASGIAIDGFLGPIDVVIANDSTISVDAYFEVTNGAMDIDVLGLGITGLTIGDDASPILSGAYSDKLAKAYNYASVNSAAVGNQEFTVLETNASNAALASTAAATTQTDAETAAAGWTQDPAPAAVAGEDVNGDTQADLDTVATDAATAALAAATTAGQAQGAVNAIIAGSTGGVDNMAYVAMTISTVDTQYGGIDNSNTAAPVKEGYLVSNALQISIDAMNLDIGATLSMGTTRVVNADTGAELVASAPASLGTIAINDLDLSGTTLKIYGH